MCEGQLLVLESHFAEAYSLMVPAMLCTRNWLAHELVHDSPVSGPHSAIGALGFQMYATTSGYLCDLWTWNSSGQAVWRAILPTEPFQEPGHGTSDFSTFMS